MKKIAIVLGAVIAVASLSGCAGRPLNSQDRAAILGASMGQALQNAHDAAYGQNGYQKEQEDYRYNQSRKHHHHHDTQVLDDQDNGVVYKHGRKGYLDADGNFPRLLISSKTQEHYHTNGHEQPCGVASALYGLFDPSLPFVERLLFKALPLIHHWGFFRIIVEGCFMSLNDEKKKGRPLNALDVSLDNWRTKFNNKKRNAFNLNRDFELEFSENTIQALIFKSHGLCYYTGLRFLNAEDVTFDRIDPNKGYSFDNVVICTSYANGIKGTHYDAPIHNGNPPIMPELARAGFLPGAMAMLNEIIRPSVKVHNLYAVIFRLEDGSRHHDMICHGVEHLKSVLKCHGSNILKDIDIYKYESCVSSENWETILPKMTDDFIEKRIINHPFKTLEGRESHYTGFLDHLNKWRKVVPQLPSNIDLASAIGCLWLAMQKEAKVVQVVRDATKDLENNPITKPLYYRELSRSGKTTRNYAYSDFRLVEDSTCETVWLVK